MICITSPAGVRMAKAYAEMNDLAADECSDGVPLRDKPKHDAAVRKYHAAAEEVARELIEQNLHNMTGP